MKLYCYDEKHQVIFGELDLGELEPNEITLIKKILEFLNKILTTRYSRLRLAKDAKIVYIEGEREIKFNDL